MATFIFPILVNHFGLLRAYRHSILSWSRCKISNRGESGWGGSQGQPQSDLIESKELQEYSKKFSKARKKSMRKQAEKQEDKCSDASPEHGAREKKVA